MALGRTRRVSTMRAFVPATASTSTRVAVATPERWPAKPRPAAGYCVRRLSHVKVVCRPDREPEAKVYLMFGPLVRSAAAGAASSPASRSASAA